MKKIYLHMGLTKTATSSFQLTCKKNIKVLVEQGFSYPLFNSSAIPCDSIKNMENHGTIISSLYRGNPRYFAPNISRRVSDFDALNKDYKATFEECFLNNEKIILSGEGISTLPIAQLKEFKQYLLSFDAEIIPLVIVRSPYEHHCSHYQQAIKTGFSADFTQWLPQSIIINNIKTIFPETQFFPFRQACKHELGPSGFLFEKLGVSCDDIIFHNANEGVANVLIRLQSALNKNEPSLLGMSENYVLQILTTQESLLINGKINENYKSIVNIISNCFKSKFYLTKEEFEKIKDDLEKENKFFDEVLGEGFKDTSIKFSDTNNMLEEIAHYFLEVNDRNAKANQAAATEQSLHSKQEIISCQMLSIVKFFVKSKYLLFLMLTKLTFSKVKKFKDKLKKIEQILVSIQK